jgi:Ser/Thr protein kinase RdoA (MazF antagonist)
MITSYQHSSLIEAEYGLHGPLEFKLIHDGPDNHVFEVIDSRKNKYALRSSKRVNKEISFEVELITSILSAGFSTPRILSTVSGKYFINAGNSKVVLFGYVEGIQIGKLEPDHIKDGFVQRGAKKLGELHRITYGMKLKAQPMRNIYTEFERYLSLGDKDISIFKGHEQVTGMVKKFKAEAISKIDAGLEPYGVIHNDYRAQNLIYTNNDCFIIDFDWSCYGPLLKDLGLAVAEWSLFTKADGPSKNAIKTFLDGYNVSAPRKVLYDESLIFWICFACLSDTCTFFADVVCGQYPDKVITDVDQCYMYRKFKHFVVDIA